jgi:hypothetical protein
MPISYNNYKDMMYRIGMFNDLFGIWHYDLNDTGTLPGGYVDGKPSSMLNYTSAMNIKWNENTNIFDFNFNGSLSLDETSNSYLNIGNLHIQNSTFKQIENTSNIVSFNDYYNNQILTITNSNVGINNNSPDPNYKLHIKGNINIEGGNIRTDGNLITASDKKFKTDIIRIDNALEKINKLTGITYNNILMKDNKRQSGLIAQDVNMVLPEVVNIDNDGNMSIAYGNMMGLIVESIKDLKNEIDIIKKHLMI